MTANETPMMPLPVAPGVLAGNAMCIGSMIAWAAAFPIADKLLETWDPLSLITMRFALAVALLMLVWFARDGAARVLRANWLRGIWVGGIGFGLGAWLLLVAQKLTDPVTVAVIAASMPVAGAILEVLFDGRRLRGRFLLGLAASVTGGTVAVFGVTSGGESLWLGGLAGLGSVILFAWGSRAAVHSFPELSAVGRTTITLAGGLVMTGAILTVAYLLGLAAVPVEAFFDPRQMLYLVIFALGALALSQLLWIAAVGRLGIAIASLHLNVAPFYVMLILLALGAGWNWQQALGAGIVGLGVLVAQWQPRRRQPPYA